MDVVTCPACGRTTLLGESICERCGADLPEPPPATPRPPTPPVHVGAADDGDPFAVDVAEVTLSIQGVRGNRVVRLRSGDLLHVGSGHGPLVDLCTDNISRRHAEVRVGATCVEVVDTGSDGRGSTNGTFVDGRRLPAGTPTQVADGQVISFATDPALTITVSMSAAR